MEEQRIYKVTKLNRSLFNDCIGSPRYVKALAFALFLKSRFATSVIPNYSAYKIAKLTNLSRATVKRRMNDLGELDLLEITGRYGDHVLIKKVKATNGNIRLDNIDFTSLKSIEQGLQALFITEVQKRKDFVKQQVNLAENPHTLKEHKKAIKVAKESVRGERKFCDNGISYKYITQKMRIGRAKVSNAINYGVKHSMFKCLHNYQTVYSANNKKDAMFFYNMLENKGQHRIIGNDVVMVKSNIYILCDTTI